jgi:hypothetical protein
MNPKIIVPAKVFGTIPEREFCKIWISKLWQAMAKLGRGYRMWTLKNQPPAGASHWRGERRPGKTGTTKLSRFLALFASPKWKSLRRHPAFAI